MEKKKSISVLLAIIIIINLIPVQIIAANSEDIITKVSTNKETLKNGQKNVDYQVSRISFKNDEKYTLDRDRFNINKLESVIGVMVNGVQETPIDSKGNYPYKIHYDKENNQLDIKIKEGESDTSHLKPFILRKHTHYNISLPAGLFKGGNRSSEKINFNFVTKGDGQYGEDILNTTDPITRGTEIDYNKSEIKFHFIDKIKINDDIGNQRNKLFKILSRSKINPNSDNYVEVEEKLDNYHIFTEDNTLIFRRKTGKLNDYAEYKVEIKKDAIRLLNSTNRQNITPIGNDHIEITFDTDEWIVKTYPENNQGCNGSNLVDRNPLIQFHFKYPVELIDRSKIEISSDGIDYAVGIEDDTWITYDDRTLKIDINSLYRSGQHPLRANAAYKIKLGKGTLRLKTHKDSITSGEVLNEDIFLYFTTGEHFGDINPGFRTTRYTSVMGGQLDNLTNLNTTELGIDGNIYIHFNKDIMWNRWTSDPKIMSEEEALEFFKFYKIPSAYKRDHDEQGVTFDSEFRYDKFGKSHPLGQKDEIIIESVEIVDGNKIKITPKYDLIPFNKYEIKLTNKDIITNNEEELLRSNDSLVLGQTIWTDKIGDEIPQWDMEMICAEDIIELIKAPTTGQRGKLVLHGAPNYNEKIDGEDGKPLILYVDGEVVTHPTSVNGTAGITMIEGYRENDPDSKPQGIKWHQLEYFKVDGKIKTKISIYPEGELKFGRYYELKINENVLYSRSGNNLTGMDIKFVVEGDNEFTRKIDKFEVTNVNSLTEGYNKFPRSQFAPGEKNLDFSITGYNFAEDITQLRLVRQEDGMVITIPGSNLKFIDVTLIEGTMDNWTKVQLYGQRISESCGQGLRNTGTYDVYVDFGIGESASSIESRINRNKLTILDRPMVKGTNPRCGEEYVNVETLRRDDDNIYIRIDFEDVDAELQLINDGWDGIQINIVGQTESIVDRTKEIKIEGNSVYVPIIESGFEENQEYEVRIIENQFIRYKELRVNNIPAGNLGCSCKFKTNYTPNTSTNGLYEGSLVEYYDRNYPMVIEGSNFNPNTRVEFKNINTGDYYRPDSITRREGRLYIYLPGGRDRLPVGQYNIEISNGPSHDVILQYGVLSIVEEGKNIPHEDYFIKDDDYYGPVKANTKSSEDVLELDRRERDRSYLTLNLDELMGQDTWSRSIEYPVNSSDRISTLKLESVWAEMELNNVRLANNYNERYIKLRIGRAAPVMVDNIKMKLLNVGVISDFIEVDGENISFDNVNIEIPYENSDGQNLRLLRYDQFSRSFFTVPSITNNVDRTVRGTSNNGGIFVIVE